MNKNKLISELTNILSAALRHKIGGIVNFNEIYAQKYSKDADILMKEAEKISLGKNWNSQDKIKIQEQLKKKLKKELESRDFLDNKKFDIMDEEMEKALKNLGLQ